MGGFIVVGAFGLVGLLLWGIALAFIIQARAGVRGGIPVQGEVYDYSEYVDRGQVMYSPRFRAQVDGVMVTGVGQTATNWKRPPLGTQVSLVYVRGDEAPLRERGVPTGTLIASIVLFLVGGSFLVTAITSTIAMSSAPPALDHPDHPDRPVHQRRHAGSQN
jgi:hypothetical protein